jgi:hypothetical protein
MADSRAPLLDPKLLATTLTARQQQQLGRVARSLQHQPHWQGHEPVALLERCWLRLEVVGIRELAGRLPPDPSEAAPELRRYRDLVSAGLAPLEAEQLCWEEFGEEACRDALVRYWQARERPSVGWTLERYLELLGRYRQFSAGGPRQLPLLILARQGSREPHQLLWLPAAGLAMRHTCA